MNGLPQESFRRLLPLLLPFLALWILFWAVPLFLGVDLALQNPDSGFAISENREIKYVGLENFERTLGDAKFHKALSNTLKYVLGSVICIIPLAFVLAVALFELPRLYRGILAFCLLIPGLALPGAMSKLFYLFFHGREGALNQYVIIPLGMDPINWMMDPDFIMPSLVMQSVWRWTGVVALFFLCALEGIPSWHFEVAKLEGMKSLSRIRLILVPGVRNLALFVGVFLVVDGVASFSGAYTLLGGSGGMLDAGLLLVTYVYQVAFPGGSGRFDLPGAAAMSLLVAPFVAGFLFLVLRVRLPQAKV
jgi:arabinosaccharide transport system permease protein